MKLLSFFLGIFCLMFVSCKEDASVTATQDGKPNALISSTPLGGQYATYYPINNKMLGIWMSPHRENLIWNDLYKLRWQFGFQRIMMSEMADDPDWFTTCFESAKTVFGVENIVICLSMQWPAPDYRNTPATYKTPFPSGPLSSADSLDATLYFRALISHYNNDLGVRYFYIDEPFESWNTYFGANNYLVWNIADHAYYMESSNLILGSVLDPGTGWPWIAPAEKYVSICTAFPNCIIMMNDDYAKTYSPRIGELSNWNTAYGLTRTSMGHFMNLATADSDVQGDEETGEKTPWCSLLNSSLILGKNQMWLYAFHSTYANQTNGRLTSFDQLVPFCENVVTTGNWLGKTP